jgi:dinuclear metal center YbgI/SA1388 family protein
MGKTDLHTIVSYCDKLLRISEVRDYDRAYNGLQVENSGPVTSIAAAVDASLATMQKACDAGANLLVVHHGLFWGPSCPWTNQRYRLMRLLLENDLAVYSSHLPLDLHPRFGNNALLCQALGLRKLKPFFFEKEQWIGLRSETKVNRDALAQKLERVLGVAPRVVPGGPEQCRSIGVVTGGAGDEVAKAAAEGVDTFITGEGRHWTYALAEELGVNIFYGGHYATETFGVKALSQHLSDKFGVPWTFIDHPTGL